MIEVRLDKGELDEVVLCDEDGKCRFHLEQLSDRQWWMGLYDGKQELRVVLYAKRATVHGFWENEGEEDVVPKGGKSNARTQDSEGHS